MPSHTRRITMFVVVLAMLVSGSGARANISQSEKEPGLPQQIWLTDDGAQIAFIDPPSAETLDTSARPETRVVSVQGESLDEIYEAAGIEFDAASVAPRKDGSASACTMPALVSPANGSTVDSISPWFMWENNFCADANRVVIEWARDAGFTQMYGVAYSYPSYPSTLARFQSNFAPATTYYWRAYAICGGMQCPSTDVWSFTTGSGGEILPGPHLYRPANGSTDQRTTLTAAWQDLDGAEYYSLQWKRVGSSSWRVKPWLADNTAQIPDLDPYTLYEWWVTAVNDYANGNDSPRWRFRTGGSWAGTITEIEVNQALGRQISDPPKFVAGKDTAIRVFLSSPVQINPATQWVVVKRDGIDVATLSPFAVSPTSVNPGEPVDVLTFLCPTWTTCSDWQAGNYTFEATVDGVTDQTTALFQTRESLRILAVPVKVKQDGVVKELSGTEWMVADQFLRQVYPVASNNVEWEIGAEVDATGFELTPEYENRVTNLVNRERSPICRVFGGPKCHDMVVGFIPPVPLLGSSACEGKCGCSAGWMTIGKPAVIVMANGSYECPCPEPYTPVREGMQVTVAHEVGHIFNLGDEYDYPSGHYQCDINPPPATYGGRRWKRFVDCDNLYHCTESTEEPFRYAGEDAGIGTNISSDLWHPFGLYVGLDVAYREIDHDVASFMGSSAAKQYYWVSPTVYDYLFDQLAPDGADQAASSSERVLYASGWLGKDDGVTLDPWYHFTGTVGTPVTATYMIEALDAASQTLAYQGFDVSFVSLDEFSIAVDPAWFEVGLAFPANTTAFRIKRDSTVLHEVPVSASVPTVAVTSPISGQVVSGNHTIAWQSSDLDGDQLYHTVEYSPDGVDWVVLASDITATQHTVGFDALGGGTQARVRVLVSDGINTSEDTSDPFVVAPKPPEVLIQAPVSGTLHLPWSHVTLVGSAYDLQDGWLRSGSSLTWSSDRDGVLGDGEIVNLYDLSEGQHTITLSAVNSQGLTNTASVVVDIGYHQVYVPMVLRSSHDGTTARANGQWAFSLALLGFLVVGVVFARRRPSRVDDSTTHLFVGG